MLHRFPQSTHAHRIRPLGTLLVHFDEVVVFIPTSRDLLGVIEDIVESFLFVMLPAGNRVVASSVVVEVCRHPLWIVNACSSWLR